ncbi:MAG: hypothetical protein JW934_08045 [Anaerolineae bacterium]|nr:hypothetical protein [Anaerolineae bacterium]
MLFIAFKRLFNRPLLTLLSIMGVTLAVGLVVSIPIFAKAVSFVMLREQLAEIAATTKRPAFSLRYYVLPSGQYKLTIADSQVWQDHLVETLTGEVGLPLLSVNRQMETTGLLLRTKEEETAYGQANTILLKDTNITVIPGIGPYLDIRDGQSMEEATPSGDALNVWIHKTLFDEMGLEIGEVYELRDLRLGLIIPTRIVGTWVSKNPRDVFWFQNPDMGLRRALLASVEDYQSIAEPLFQGQLGFVSWYFIMDDSKLVSERMKEYSGGLKEAAKIISQYLPNPRMDSSPSLALDTAIRREADLTVLMFVFSVPVMAFLLYFLSLLSSITIRWQQRETAVMASRGMQVGQLISVSIIEAAVIIGVGTPLGILAGIQLAQAMGYTESFMKFVWREPLPVSPTTFNIPMVLAALSASLLARLWPMMRAARTSVVAHERRRARAPDQPFWQRFYLDFLLLIPVIYAYRQLTLKGTLVPAALSGEEGAQQDPLMFLVPALFTLTMSLLLVRLFPILMRIGDWLSSLGRDATLYLAFRQLARQSNQYTSALLLVITSLSLGAFMASMALSLDQWLIDRVYYAVGSDVLIRQTISPEDAEARVIPTEGAWILPPESYEELPGVINAARVGMYDATLAMPGRRSLRGVFIGIDRLDAPTLLFWRPDFSQASLGELMNRLAAREDAVILSEEALRRGEYAIGDKVRIRVNVADQPLETDFTIAGQYKFFPTVFESEATAVIGNLDFLFDQLGATLLHNVWLQVEDDVDHDKLIEQVEDMGVFVSRWVNAQEEIAEEQAQIERVGIFGTLTVGFLAAAVLSGIGLLIYNYASLQERLFRFTILRAVGLSLLQVISQVSIEYVVLMVYSVLGGALIGVWASGLFIPFFQAADMNVIRPPTLLPLIAWNDISQISAAFTVVLVAAQIAVIAAALRKGVFQALRLGDQE